MREASTKLVYEYVKKYKQIIVLSADSRNGYWERIRDEFPLQYIDYGIAEQNMIASAAGLSAAGKIPFIFGTSTFLSMRAYEFIRNDICIPNMNVKILGIFSGLSRPSWGATHQGTEELALLRCLPNIQVITPSTPVQAREATRYAYEHKGPVYIRLEASGETEYYDDDYKFVFGEGRKLLNLSIEADLVFISLGAIADMVVNVAKELHNQNIECQVIDMPAIKPIDKKIIYDCLEKNIPIITIEEHSLYGGLGSAVAEVIAESGKGLPFCRMGLDGVAKGCGNRESVRITNGISSINIENEAKKLLRDSFSCRGKINEDKKNNT